MEGRPGGRGENLGSGGSRSGKHETHSEPTCRGRLEGKWLRGRRQGFGPLGQRGHHFLLWGKLGGKRVTEMESSSRAC